MFLLEIPTKGDWLELAFAISEFTKKNSRGKWNVRLFAIEPLAFCFEDEVDFLLVKMYFADELNG